MKKNHYFGLNTFHFSALFANKRPNNWINLDPAVDRINGVSSMRA